MSRLCKCCESPIAEKRLAAVPHARFCVRCQPPVPLEVAVPGLVAAIAEPGEADGVRPPAYEIRGYGLVERGE